MVDELELVHGNAAVLDAKEKFYGLNYEPTDILWCHEVRPHLRFPEVVYWDHMHCLAANGGVTQHESNQFILRTCQRKGLPVHAWDEFHQTTEGMRPLRKDFFQTRVVNNDRAHFRGFAADTLAAMDVKGLFI